MADNGRTLTRGAGTMTKAQMQATARRARVRGHFDFGSRLEVNCPLCATRVSADWNRAFGSVPKVLDGAMIDHLDWECAQGNRKNYT